MARLPDIIYRMIRGKQDSAPHSTTKGTASLQVKSSSPPSSTQVVLPALHGRDLGFVGDLYIEGAVLGPKQDGSPVQLHCEGNLEVKGLTSEEQLAEAAKNGPVPTMAGIPILDIKDSVNHAELKVTGNAIIHGEIGADTLIEAQNICTEYNVAGTLTAQKNIVHQGGCFSGKAVSLTDGDIRMNCQFLEAATLKTNGGSIHITTSDIQSKSIIDAGKKGSIIFDGEHIGRFTDKPTLRAKHISITTNQEAYRGNELLNGFVHANITVHAGGSLKIKGDLDDRTRITLGEGATCEIDGEYDAKNIRTVQKKGKQADYNR